MKLKQKIQLISLISIVLGVVAFKLAGSLFLSTFGYSLDFGQALGLYLLYSVFAFDISIIEKPETVQAQSIIYKTSLYVIVILFSLVGGLL